MSEKGRIMARIPVDPKLSRILIEAGERGCLQEAAIIASALSIPDPRQRPQDKIQQADQKHAVFKDPASDFISLLNIWNSCYGDQRNQNGSTESNDESGRKENRIQSPLKSRNSARKFCKEHYLSFRRMREWSDIHNQIIAVLNEHGIRETGKTGLTSARTESSSTTAPDSMTGNSRRLRNDALKEHKSEIGGEFYAALHKSILAGYLGNIANKKEKNLYHAAKGQKAMIFPGSSIFNKAGNWIVASEYVETSQLFARTAATIDVDWLEEIGKSLCTYSWSSPHWEKKRGEVVAKEQVSLFGLVIVPERTVAYGKINPVEAGEIFIRHALVNGDTDMKFPFIQHNQRLTEELEKLEEKTRKRDILVTEEDIYLFYRNRLERDFCNIRTFAKYLKDKKDDSFLRMTHDDLRQKSIDQKHLAGFPDTIKTGEMEFRLEYDFSPGAETDGVTVKVPAPSAACLLSCGHEPFFQDTGTNKRAAFTDWIVPGLFREKIMALIKNLPKSQRIKLLPASEKADIIAEEIRNTGRPLFHELSSFIKERFNADIPLSAWSDEGLEPHLKMRISIRDESDREIAASRNFGLLREYVETSDNISDPGFSRFDEIKKKLETENIRSWDFIESWNRKRQDRDSSSCNLSALPRSVTLGKGDRVSCELFPAFTVEKTDKPDVSIISLRLFRTEESADEAHRKGVRELFCICYENDMNALKKDIRNAARLRGYASFFGGVDHLNKSLYDCITMYLFSYNIRTPEEFKSHAETALGKLYTTGQELISEVTGICEEYQSVLSFLNSISLKNMNRESLFNLMDKLVKDLQHLVPSDFLQKCPYSRIPDLKRYIAAIGIRAKRAVDEPARDQKKWAEVAGYVRRFETICNVKSAEAPEKLSSGLQSLCISAEKRDAIEKLFWMIEEYKVSLFAQELKTAIKVSPGRLNTVFQEIERMI